MTTKFTCFASSRRVGKTWATAQALDMTTNELLTAIQRQKDEIAAWERAHPDVEPLSSYSAFFRRQYLGEFSFEPELVGPPAPSFEVWDANQRRNAREVSRFYRHDWSAI